jgi:hypothetical protein
LEWDNIDFPVAGHRHLFEILFSTFNKLSDLVCIHVHCNIQVRCTRCTYDKVWLRKEGQQQADQQLQARYVYRSGSTPNVYWREDKIKIHMLCFSFYISGFSACCWLCEAECKGNFEKPLCRKNKTNGCQWRQQLLSFKNSRRILKSKAYTSMCHCVLHIGRRWNPQKNCEMLTSKLSETFVTHPFKWCSQLFFV